MYLLIKRGHYYRPDNKGYCAAKSDAGRYTKKDAEWSCEMSDAVSMVHEDDAKEFSPAHEPKAIDEIERLRNALTPSADTKADYMGEFKVDLPDWDEDGNEVMRHVNVPWTTIKEIMAHVLQYAAPSVCDATKEGESE